MWKKYFVHDKGETTYFHEENMEFLPFVGKTNVMLNISTNARSSSKYIISERLIWYPFKLKKINILRKEIY